MRRRQFLTLMGGAAAWPRKAVAQPPARTRIVGVLSGMSNEGQGNLYVRALTARLRALGWVEGRNLRIDYRWGAGDESQIRRLATVLVASRPDIVVAITTPVVAALRDVTRDIPLVFANMSDPMDGGYVQSLARPGGNITGFTSFEYSIGGKWVELLKEAVPSLRRVLALHNPGNYTSRALVAVILQSAPTIGVEVIAGGVQSPDEIETRLAEFAQRDGGGIVLVPDPLIQASQTRIVALAIRHRLPSLHQSREFPSTGGLMSYGTDFTDVYARVAEYVDRILKGEKPADLPVQAPTRYELVINLKAAAVLGLTVPPTLLARADEVIE